MESTLLDNFRVHFTDEQKHSIVELSNFYVNIPAGQDEHISDADVLDHDTPVLECCSSEVPCINVDIKGVLEGKVDTNHGKVNTNRLPKFLPIVFGRNVKNDKGCMQKNFRVVVFPITIQLSNGSEYTLIGAGCHKVNDMNTFL